MKPMKRNQYGINFDLGVPLLSEEEFEILYVELYPEQKQRLIDWINDKGRGPMIVAGQIGSGKTTLIEKSRQEASSGCDIRIAMDTDIPMYEPGAFWGVFLGKVIEFAKEHKCNLKAFQLPEEFLDIKYDDDGLAKLTKALCDKPASLSDFNKKKQLYHFIDEKLEFIKRQLATIIEIVKNEIGRKIFVFAEGIDKFNLHTPEYISLLDLLNFLSRCKTLYETNILHCLGIEQWQKGMTKIFLTGVSTGEILEVFRKRLHIYAPPGEDVLLLLAQFSGGNIRQGLRLLVEYDEAVRKKGKDKKEALDYTCRMVRDAFLIHLSGNFESELLKVVHKDKYITAGTLLELASSGHISRESVYSNWILITGEADMKLKWPASVNPLLLPAIDAFKDVPESPETKLLREWAEAHETSAFGLEIDISTMDRDTFFDILSHESSILPLNVMEIFENMAAYFLNAERKDKIIIGYENKKLAMLANDLLIGKAGVYKPGSFKDISFDDIPQHQLAIYLGTLSGKGYDGYSIFFESPLSPKELVALDLGRDTLIDYKMIWWIPYNHLKGYIKYWLQLIQFFKVFRLEEDLMSNISVEEIEEDLVDIKAIDFSGKGKKQLKKRLQKILNYLKTEKNGQ